MLCATTFVLALAAPTAVPAQLITCRVLRTSANDFSGRCTRDNTTIALLVLRSPTRPAEGRWLGTQARLFGHGADTADVVDWAAFGPTFADIGRADSVFNWCWCRITRFDLDSVSLFFEADPGRPVPANADDLAILQRVSAQLSEVGRWNRRSDRNRNISYCPKDPPSRTLFCSLYESSVAVRGDYFPGAAVGAIQRAIGVVSSRDYQHPLDGFNNDALVEFVTLQRMLEEAERRIRMSLTLRGGD